ncbi:helix-turn-helix transcriptional regulator [Luteolibacter soli]|uniref:Helix-turn-helix transcriptional regulator n=1 Tax=Luteolibacter soli TaxID=3135280 RepID=A0ABU9AT28_9BACT
MPKASSSNVIAALRYHIHGALKQENRKLTQSDFARLIGRTAATIKSIESGRLALSDDLAKRISQVTGVSLPWLLKGDSSQPIRARDGKPYALAHLERAQFELRDRKEGKAPFGIKRAVIATQGETVADLVRELSKRFARHPDGEFRMWKLQQAVKRVDEEFAALP